MIARRKTRQIELGGIKAGGGAPITVQSMTKTDTRDAPGDPPGNLVARGGRLRHRAVRRPGPGGRREAGRDLARSGSHSSPTSTSNYARPSSRSSRAWTGCG